MVASYYFYMCWNPKYVILLFGSTLITYISGQLIDIFSDITYKKITVACSLVLNLGILVIFKYADFMIDILNGCLAKTAFSIHIKSLDILLPVGISFYIFQALSYTLDVYRGKIKAEKNLGKYALFVSFFPQLVAGPIERSGKLLNQLKSSHYFEAKQVVRGLELMLWGFFEKLVIADRCALLVNEVFDNYVGYQGFQIVIGVTLFAIEIYCDFAGYTDIAIGAAEVLGIHLMQNFDKPYFACSIKEFWRRWHISLSTWFRDYLYIPLGGSRKGRVRKYANLMITFLISGLWHGANWTYIFGGVYGLYQIVGEILMPVKDKMVRRCKVRTEVFSYKLFQGIITFILVDFAWIFFRADTLNDAIMIIKNMFAVFNIWIFFDGSLLKMGLDGKDLGVLIISIVILIMIDTMRGRGKIRNWFEKQNCVFKALVLYVAIFTVLILGIYGYGYEANDFIYFQF